MVEAGSHLILLVILRHETPMVRPITAEVEEEVHREDRIQRARRMYARYVVLRKANSQVALHGLNLVLVLDSYDRDDVRRLCSQIRKCLPIY